MTTGDDAVRLVEARRLIASGFTREVRLAADLSYRRCSAAIDHQASHVALLRWENGTHVPRRNAAGAIAYVDFIRRVMRNGVGLADAS